MKCFTLSDNEIMSKVDLNGLPVDASLSGKKEMDTLKVVAMMPDREGIDPESLFGGDFGRATACCSIMFSKSEEDTDDRVMIKFDPRKWVLDCDCKDGFLVYRSRDFFIAIGNTKDFKMKRISGGAEMLIEDTIPVIKEKWSPPKDLPDVDDGWFIATME